MFLSLKTTEYNETFPSQCARACGCAWNQLVLLDLCYKAKYIDAMIEKREKQQILTLVKFMFFLKMTNNSELSKHFPDHFLSLSKTNSIQCIQKVVRPLCFVHILLFHSLLLN